MVSQAASAHGPTVAPAAQAPGRLPARIGRFRVLDKLGRGAQGVVYLAVDEDLGRRVAIKTVLAGRQPSAALVREARTVSRLVHPNIVPVYEMGEHAGNAYIVYEHVPGRTLRERLREGPLPVAEALRIARQALDALAFAHREGIVHRDIKPANLCLDANGTLRVMDFGVSALVGTRAEPVHGVLGSARYLAPEQLSGGTIGPGTDLFSLALVLAEMLTGRPVVASEDPVAAMYAIAHEPLALPRAGEGPVDAALAAVLTRALEKAPERRYRGAEAMREALAACMPADEGGAGSTGASGKAATLAFLMRRMRRNADFPAAAANIAELRAHTSVAGQSSAGEIANIILKDYALATKVLKLVNSPLYGQFGGRISTISRAVVILGFERVRAAALSLLVFEHLENRPQARELRESASRSFLSGVLARGLAHDTHGIEPEEAFVCSMLRRLGHYLTIYYLPDEYNAIRDAMQARELGEDAACRAVLGVTFDEIGTGVAREWRLPQSVIDCMQPLPPGPLARARNSGELLQRLAGLGNELCELVVDTPPEQREARLAGLQSRFEQNLPLRRSRLLTLVEDALDAAREHACIAGFAGGGGALGRAERWLDKAGAGTSAGGKPPGDAERAAASAAPGGDGDEYTLAQREELDESRQVLLAGIQDVSNALLENCALNDVLVMVLETLFRGLRFRRVLFCVHDRRMGRVSARFGLGRDVDLLVKRFQFDTAQAADPLARAVRERTDLVCPSPRVGTANLPRWFRQTVGSSVFALLPVVVNGVCIGVLYCDHEGTGARIDGDQLNYLNTLRNQAALAIKQHS